MKPDHVEYGHLTTQARRIMRHVQIQTRRLLNGMLVGDSRSAVKGPGLELDQIREYRAGDDIRFIDWNASARYNDLLVKECFEERSRSVFLCVDISHSVDFGSSERSKREMIAEIAGTVALMAEYGRDRVGLTLFAGDIELVLPARRGFAHVHRIMEELLSHQAKTPGTSIGSALEWLARVRSPGAVAFLISDFIGRDQEMERYLPVVSRRHDLVAVRVLDGRERSMPVAGFVTMEDNETGEQVLIDTRMKKNYGVESFLAGRTAEQDSLLKRRGIDVIDIMPGKPFAADLVRFFRRRMRY